MSSPHADRDRSQDRRRVIRTEFGSWECPWCHCRNALVRNDDGATASCDNCRRVSDLPEPLGGPAKPDDRHSVMDDEMHVDHPDWPGEPVAPDDARVNLDDLPEWERQLYALAAAEQLRDAETDHERATMARVAQLAYFEKAGLRWRHARSEGGHPFEVYDEEATEWVPFVPDIRGCD